MLFVFEYRFDSFFFIKSVFADVGKRLLLPYSNIIKHLANKLLRE